MISHLIIKSLEGYWILSKDRKFTQSQEADMMVKLSHVSELDSLLSFSIFIHIFLEKL